MTVISRTNLCPNPSFESSSSGWSAGSAGTAPAITQSPTKVYVGSESLQITWATSSSLGYAQISVTTTPGSVYTASAWVFVPTGSPVMQLAVSGVATGAASSVFDTWTRISVAFTATAATSVLRAQSTAATTAGPLCYVDAALVELTSSLLPYFDGATPGASWSGTAGLSTSTLTAFDTSPSLPLATIEFDALAPQATEFIIGTSLIGGPGLLSATPRWVSVVALIQTVDITRGRSDINTVVQAGECTIVADNASGAFDPDNTASPYNQGQINLAPGMRVRISALFASGGTFTAQTLFVGRCESIVPSKGWDLTAELTFVDDLAIYGQTTMTSFNNAIRAGDTTAQRAAWLASLVPSTGSTPNLSAQLGRLMVPTYGGGQVADELNALATAEAGRLFVDRNGNLTVTAHADEYTSPTIATLTDQMTPLNGIEYNDDLTTSSGRMRLINSVTVQRYTSPSTYPDVFGSDSASISQYGQTSLPAVVAPLQSTADAQALATYLGTRRSKPQSTIDQVTVDFAGQPSSAALLAAELGNRVVTVRATPYLSGTQLLSLECTVEGIKWAIAADTFEGTFSLAPTDGVSLFGGAGAFIIGSSLIGGSDVLTAY